MEPDFQKELETIVSKFMKLGCLEEMIASMEEELKLLKHIFNGRWV